MPPEGCLVPAGTSAHCDLGIFPWYREAAARFAPAEKCGDGRVHDASVLQALVHPEGCCSHAFDKGTRSLSARRPPQSPAEQGASDLVTAEHVFSTVCVGRGVMTHFINT